MCLDCSGVTTENSAICVCFLMRYGDSVVLVTLIAILFYSLVNYCRHWVGNQQTCCFRKLLQRCHSACCVPFRWMVDEGCDCFCRRWWHGQVFVSDDCLRFGGCLTWGCFDLHRQVGEMYESVCRVNEYTVIPHRMQSKYWPCQCLHYDEVFSKWIISNFKFESGCW